VLELWLVICVTFIIVTMTKDDVYKTIDSVPDGAKETHIHLYFKESILKKLRMKTELKKKGFITYSIPDTWMDKYDMVISGGSIYYED